MRKMSFFSLFLLLFLLPFLRHIKGGCKNEATLKKQCKTVGTNSITFYSLYIQELRCSLICPLIKRVREREILIIDITTLISSTKFKVRRLGLVKPLMMQISVLFVS